MHSTFVCGRQQYSSSNQSRMVSWNDLPDVLEFSNVVHLDEELVTVALLELVEVRLRRLQLYMPCTHAHTLVCRT